MEGRERLHGGRPEERQHPDQGGVRRRASSTSSGATPAEVEGDSQGRGNSGVFLMGRYEIQVLDCYDNPTYADGMAGAIYGQYPPLVNASRPPGEWQTYDIVWMAPRFDGESLVTPAYGTVFLNGILVQYNLELIGPHAHRHSMTTHRTQPKGRSSSRTTATRRASATSGTGLSTRGAIWPEPPWRLSSPDRLP